MPGNLNSQVPESKINNLFERRFAFVKDTITLIIFWYTSFQKMIKCKQLVDK